MNAILRSLLGVFLVMAMVCLPCVTKVASQSELVEYKIPITLDFSGPYADLSRYLGFGCESTFAWWNKEYSTKLGVKLTPKPHDSRYDPAVIASLYPGIVAELKPISWIGLGGPTVAALKGRLPYDKIAMVNISATYGFDWKSPNYIVYPRPTFPHEFAGWLDWALKNIWKEPRPMRIANVSNDKPPAYVDAEKGFKKFISEVYPGKAEYLGSAWVDMVPVDVTEAIRPFVAKGVDYFFLMSNVPQAVATAKACTALGKHIPLVTATHLDTMFISKVLGWEKMEGFYDTGCMASALNHDIPAYKEIWLKHLPKGADPVKDWTLGTIQSVQASIIVCRAVEKAIARVGARNLTGEAIYQSFFEPWKKGEEMGISMGFGWTSDSPFPKEENLGAMFSTVKGGKHLLATKEYQPVPKIPKW